MPPVTLVPGSRAETASGNGNSGLQVLDNVIIMGVRGHICLPEALVIWKESVPGAVDLHASKFLFSLCTTIHMSCLEGGYVTIRHPVIVRPAPVLNSLYRGQEGPAPGPGWGAGVLCLEEHVPVMCPVAA